jgi:transcriptional regulator with XRE-family HTH domain
MNIKEIRKKAGFSQTEAATLANCSPNSWRLFEANREALTPELRSKCDAALAKIEAVAVGTAA